MFIFARYLKIIARKERADIELMRYLTKAFSLVILFWTMVLSAQAQVTGVVVDRESGDTIPFASLIYKGHHISAMGKERLHFFTWSDESART